MKKAAFVVAMLAMIFIACENPPSSKQTSETAISGYINMSVDESFQPVISEEIKVFQSSYPKADIRAHYKSEADCLRDLQNDSTRLVIISRGLTDDELSYYKGKLDFKPLYDLLAFDAIAVIINRANADSSYSVADLKEMLSGKRDANVVLDGKNATSTVRYLMDSVLRGLPLGKNVTAAQGSLEVVKYVANNAGAIGFVGVSWLTESEDPEMIAALSKIRMASIECKYCGKGNYVRPSQETIMNDEYPLVRGLHYILKENWSGLGTGLVNFMSIERGQLIFRRSYLAPGQMQFNKRKTRINKSE